MATSERCAFLDSWGFASLGEWRQSFRRNGRTLSESQAKSGIKAIAEAIRFSDENKRRTEGTNGVQG